MKKIISILLCVVAFGGFAQEIQPVKPTKEELKNMKPIKLDCAPAEDSAKARMQRGEMGFYKMNRSMAGQYLFYVFYKDKYTRTDCPKGDPNAVFVYCYNNAMKKTLDSVYKTNFLVKSDSVLMSYDRSGRGYRAADFPHGPAALQKYLEKNVVLPKGTQPDDSDRNFKVYYSFLVDEKGKLSDFKLEKSNCKACEGPLLDVIKKIPAFTPASEAGVPKKVRYILTYTKPRA